MTSRSRSLAFSFAVIFFACLVATAQSPPDEKPKLKDFGSSLKKLKWDPVKQTAVESRKQPKQAGASDDVDVIRVQTDLVTLDVQVRDRQGRLVSDLTQDDFIAQEDGQRQTIGHFSLGADRAVGRSIVLDP